MEDSKKFDDPDMSVKYLDIKPPVQDSAIEISWFFR